MVIGVSTRKYNRSPESTGNKLKTRGTSRSAVSPRFVSGTEKRLEELLSRDLSGLDIAVLMLNGLVVSDHVALVALGVDAEGHKHPLGVQEGATENTTACTRLLTDLRDRGFRTGRSLLVVMDGSKALRKAVEDVFGNRAVVQRCQEHKIRNVTGHLPTDMQLNVRRSMQDAYRCGKRTQAKKLLENLERALRGSHPGAASALAEGLDETLAVIDLGLPRMLERTLSTTNMIENLNGSVRDVTHNVKCWHDGTMVLRWLAAALLEAQKSFRRVRGYKACSALLPLYETVTPNSTTTLKSLRGGRVDQVSTATRKSTFLGTTPSAAAIWISTLVHLASTRGLGRWRQACSPAISPGRAESAG